MFSPYLSDLYSKLELPDKLMNFKLYILGVS